MTTATEERRFRPTDSRRLALWLYVVGAFGLGVTALFGGGNLLFDPSGSRMNMPAEWLAGTPFPDYFLPGLFLFTVFGVGSFAVLYGVVRRRVWAWHAALGLGILLVGWILAQMYLLQMVNVLHFVYGALGLLLAGVALLPSVRTELRG